MSKGQRSQQELSEHLRLPKEEVREAVRRLESSNEIYRSEVKGDAYLYSRSVFEPRPRKDCLLGAVERHIAYHAPITVEDMAYEVGILEHEADETLHELASTEVVVAGRFVVGEQQQYMLARDYLRLKSDGKPVFDR